MKFKTLFITVHDLLLFFNISNQFLAPCGLNAECVKISVMQTWGLQGAGSEAPRPEKLQFGEGAKNPTRMMEKVCDQHQLIKHSLNFILKQKFV